MVISSVFLMQQRLILARIDPSSGRKKREKAIRKLAVITLLDTFWREREKKKKGMGFNQNVQCRKMASASRNFPLKL